MAKKIYVPSNQITDQISKTYASYSPTESQNDKFADLADAFEDLALEVSKLTPPSREQSIVLTKLEEAYFFAISSIMKNETEDA